MKKRRSQKGQVLVVAVILIVLLLLGIFIFFDLHNVIRAKLKMETAEQAAALTAARWQGETLNLIGEINLIMASEALISDGSVLPVPPDVAGDDPDKQAVKEAAARVKALSEMQSRISFIGPLIALASSQQAAKNNGVKTPTDSKSPWNDFEVYLRRLNDPAEARYMYNDKVNGYYWRESYALLLQAIIDSGIVSRPNDRTAGMQNIQPYWLYGDFNNLWAFFEAIIACDRGEKNWCNYKLLNILKGSHSFEGDWYKPSFESMSFPKQSEIYSVDVEMLGSGSDEGYNYLEQSGIDLLPREDDPGTSREEPNLSSIPRFYGYEQRWYNDSVYYTGPDTAWTSPWRRGVYLQSDLKNSVVHGGAVAYAECYVNVDAVTEFRAGSGGVDGLKNPVRTKNMTTSRVGGNFADDYAYSGVVAKPLGEIMDDKPPMELPLVLPVFKRVSIIPSTMQQYRVFTATDQPLEKFIEWLAQLSGSDLYDTNLNPPPGTEYALEALRILAREDFRKRGYNPEFPGLESVAQQELFTDSYFYPQRSDGAGWLQQACIRKLNNPPPDASPGSIYRYDAEVANEVNEKEKQAQGSKARVYPVPPNGETWYFNGSNYYIAGKNGKILNNEDDPYFGCGSRQGGGGGGPSGSNSGPSRL